MSGPLRRRTLLAAGAALPAVLGGPLRSASADAAPAPDPAGAGRAAAPDAAAAMRLLDPQPPAADALRRCVPGPDFPFAGTRWTVREDRTDPDGPLFLMAADGRAVELKRRTESYAPRGGTPFLGLDPARLGTDGRDLLAERLLAGGGDPDLDAVRLAAPGPATRLDSPDTIGRLVWTVFVGTRQGTQPMPLSATGSTRTLHADQVVHGVPDLHAAAARRAEGLLGGDLPVVLHRIPAGSGRYWEVLSFADTDAAPGRLVPGFQRICLVEHGQVLDTRYRGTDPAFGPWRADPSPGTFFSALLRCVASWRAALADMATCRLPDPSWSDMARHAFVVELIAKPSGTWPSYGAVDRDYAGSEYDAFQDTINATLQANLLWNRFDQAAAILDGALGCFTTADGLPTMRGPEVGQTGLFLALVARTLLLTGDAALPARHRDRIRAVAAVLTTLHDQALALPPADPGHGLLHGWSESDSCLFPDPSIWWKPYYNNTALAARGLRELAGCWTRIDPAGAALAADWNRRAAQLCAALERSLRASVRHDLSPPYVPILPGARRTFRESLAAATPEHPSEQQWPHRAYAELLQAAVLPPDLEALTLDAMRGHGATSMGVVANITAPAPQPRDLLGFISHGYAEALLRQDRIPEYLLFLYAHRCHCHTPGSWTAAEVADLQGGLPLFCVPAQMTVPILLRWALAYEDPDREELHLARAVPTAWLADPAGLSASDLPTRWGRVGFSLRLDPDTSSLHVVVLPPASGPRTLLLHLRLPPDWRMLALPADAPAGTVLRPASRSGSHPLLQLSTPPGVPVQLVLPLRHA